MNQVDPFEHVVIVGAGLLGTSLGLALRGAGLARVITGVGRAGSGSLDVALGRGAVDRVSTDLAAAARGNGGTPAADLVVLCMPLRQFPDAMRVLSGALRRGAIVTDVGSVKGEVMGWAEEILPASSGVHFVGSHPMAGSEKSGPEAARADLYRGAVCLMCEGKANGREAFERVRGMWESIGMRVMGLEAREHDRWVATVSHLPHAVAFSLVNAASREPAMLAAVAGGFLDTTRVASSDVAMWTDIFLTNKEAALQAMEVFTGELASLRAAIGNGDEKEIRELLSRGKESRDALIAKRKVAGLRNGESANRQDADGAMQRERKD